MIPAEAVEAAERAAGCVFGSPVSAKEMEGMIKILEAAAPLMLAGAKEEAFIAGVRVGIKKQAEYERGQSLLATNPRRSQT